MIGENKLYGVVLYTFFYNTSVDCSFWFLTCGVTYFYVFDGLKTPTVWECGLIMVVAHSFLSLQGLDCDIFRWTILRFVWGMCLGWSGVYPKSIWAHKGARCANDWGGRNQFNSDLVKTPTWSSTNLEKGKHNSHMILLHSSASTGHGTIGHDLQERTVLASGTRNT
jgi:hypothetical protein